MVPMRKGGLATPMRPGVTKSATKRFKDVLCIWFQSTWQIWIFGRSSSKVRGDFFRESLAGLRHGSHKVHVFESRREWLIAVQVEEFARRFRLFLVFLVFLTSLQPVHTALARPLCFFVFLNSGPLTKPQGSSQVMAEENS